MAFRWRVFAGLGALILVAHFPVVVVVAQGHAPFGGDALAVFAPWREFANQALFQGVLPLWNPHVYSGMPFFANGQSALFYPPNLVYLLLPPAPAQWLDAYGHQWLLATGAYALARALNLGRAPAVLVAILFALGHAVSARLEAGHLTWHAARAWIPWLLCGTLLFLRHGKKRFAWGAALCLVLLLAAGHPLVALLGIILNLALIAVYLVAQRGANPQKARLPLPTIFAALLLSATLSATLVWPLREAGDFSLRQREMSYERAIAGSGSVRSFVRLLLPNFFGGNSESQWSIRLFPHEEAVSLGLIPALLALGAPWLARNRCQKLPRAVPWLWGAMLLAALLSLGEQTPLYEAAFRFVPLFKTLHVPVRWLELWYFMAALLAGFAFEGCCQHKARFNRIFAHILAVFGGGLGLFAVLIAFPTPLFSPMPTALDAVELHHAALVSCLTGALVAMAGALLLARLKLGRVWRNSLLGLITLELLTLSWSSGPPQTNETKAASQWPRAVTAQFVRGQRWDSDFSGAWKIYAWNGGLSRGIDLFGGYDPLGPERFFVFASALQGSDAFYYPYQPKYRSTLLRVAGVTHTLQAPPTKAPKTTFGVPKQVFRHDSWALWQHKGAWPRVYLTNNVREIRVEDQVLLLEKLAARDFYRQNRPVVLAPGTWGDFSVASSVSPGRIVHWTRSLNRFDVDLDAKSPAVLVIGDTFYAGWRAYAKDVGELKIAPANYLFRGVPVPKGARRVTLVYEPQTVRVAFFVSLCGLAALVFIGVQGAPRLWNEFLKKPS